MKKNIFRILLAILVSVFASMPVALAQEYEDGGIYTDEDGNYYRYDASIGDFIELDESEVAELLDEDDYSDNDDGYYSDNDDDYSGYTHGSGEDLNEYEHIRGERPEGNLGVWKYSVTNSNRPYILETPYVDTAYKIYDFAGVLTDKQKTAIQRRCHEFVNNTGLDIAIVTLKSNNHPTTQQAGPTESFICDFYDYNDFRPDGVMLCLDLEYSKNWITDAGKPYRAGLMDAAMQTYPETMRPLFDSRKYYDEIMWFINSAEADWIYDQSFPVWKCLIFGTLLALVIFFIHYSKYKLVFKGTTANNYKVPDSFVLTQNETHFVRTFTTKTYSPQSKGGGGGRSSSGGGHGGGGF